MKAFVKALVVSLFCALASTAAQAGVIVVSSCNAATGIPAGSVVQNEYMDVNGNHCTTGPIGAGGATAANQTAVQAAPGSDAASAVAVQGVTGGKAVKVDGSAVTQPVSGTVTVGGAAADGAAASGNPERIGGVYKSTPPTYTDGQQTSFTMTANGGVLQEPLVTTNSAADGNSNTIVTPLGTQTGGTVSIYTQRSAPLIYNGSTWDRQRTIQGFNTTGTGVAAVEQNGSTFSNITTNTTTTVKSGAGILHRICINTKGASANVATVYDNTAGSGTKIGTLDTTSGPICLQYEVGFATGLTIVTATGTAADLTVAYR